VSNGSQSPPSSPRKNVGCRIKKCKGGGTMKRRDVLSGKLEIAVRLKFPLKLQEHRDKEHSEERGPRRQQAILRERTTVAHITKTRRKEKKGRILGRFEINFREEEFKQSDA